VAVGGGQVEVCDPTADVEGVGVGPRLGPAVFGDAGEGVGTSGDKVCAERWELEGD